MLRQLLAATVLVAPLALAAQSHPLVGTWNIEYAGGMRIENGEQTRVMLSATLVVAAQGDSLIATLTSHAQEGVPERPAVRMAAPRANGDVTFPQIAQMRMNMNGEISVHDVKTNWTLHAAGDALEGTMTREVKDPMLPGMNEPVPVKGTRAKG